MEGVGVVGWARVYAPAPTPPGSGSPLTAAKRGLPPMSRDSLPRSTGTPHPLTVRVCVLTVSVRPWEGHDINDDVCVPLQRLWAF